jgi:hypothetical protein
VHNIRDLIVNILNFFLFLDLMGLSSFDVLMYICVKAKYGLIACCEASVT